MHGMTLGQVLVAFDGLTAYVMMTSPFGGGGEAEPGADRRAIDGVREFVGADEPGAVGLLGGATGGTMPIITIDDVPDDIRDLLG